MSAFVVDKAHIDYMVSAGLLLVHPGDTLTWLWSEEGPPNTDELYERGEPWGRGYYEWVRRSQRRLDVSTAGRVGAMLLAENRRSVNFRYDEDDWEEPYTFEPVASVDPVVVLKALSCYEYQACEHPEWEASEAHAFCEALRQRAIASLPGYAEAPWGISDEWLDLRRSAARIA